MNKKLLFFRLYVLVVAMMSALSLHAQEAYANYTPSDSTLTFYYDNQRSSRTGTTYDMNTGSHQPGWYILRIQKSHGWCSTLPLPMRGPLQPTIGFVVCLN